MNQPLSIEVSDLAKAQIRVEEAAPILRQAHRMVAVAGHADGLDQPLLSKVSEVAGP